MKRERVFLLSVLALLAAVTFASCKNRQAEVPEAAKVISGLEKMTGEITISGIADRIWDFSQTRPNGFTLNLRTITEPTEGIAVSYAIPRNCNSRDELDKVVIHALLHDGYIGGWFDSEDSLYYFDSTKLFPEDELDEALKFGKENGQHSVYILSTGTYVRVNQ